MEDIRRADPFIVHMQGNMSSADFQVLSLFYQPIIGAEAFSLYAILQSLLDRQSLSSQEYVHADLESLLNRKCADIQMARVRLEAIGLMDTHYLDDHFIYELKLPISAQSFVNDGILGQYLLSAVTKNRFKKLIQLFKIKVPNIQGYHKITKTFDEVFPALYASDTLNEENMLGNGRAKQVKASQPSFDWRLFSDSIPSDFFDPQELTDAIKNKIKMLHYVYGLDELEMKDVYLKAMDGQKKISSAKLAIIAREQYKLHQQSLHSTLDKNTKANPVQRNLPTDPIQYFQMVSPKALLEDMGGGQASAADLRIVERLIEEVGLNEGVINVLIAYVAKIKDGTLPGYDYFEKVALSWKRNQIDNVELAMDYVKHLKAKYEKSQADGKPRTGRTSKPKRPDVQIDWLDDYIKSLE